MTRTTTPTNIKFSEVFNKQLKTAPRNIRAAFLEALQMFIIDPSHPSLRNHVLQNKLAGYRSIDITEDWRAIYRSDNDQIIFVNIGTHKQLYH